MRITLLVIIPILLVGIFVLVSFGNRSRSTPSFSFKSIKIYKGIAIGYGLLLILATAIFYLFPPESVAAGKTYIEQDVEQELTQFYSALEKQDLSQLDPDYIRKSWTFETSPALSNITLNLQFMDSTIITVPTDENQITIDYYCSPFYMSGYELTNFLPNPDVNLTGDRLNISMPRLDLNLASLNKEFTISQFIAKDDSLDFFFHHGHMAFIIHLPASITLETDHEPLYQFDQ